MDGEKSVVETLLESLEDYMDESSSSLFTRGKVLVDKSVIKEIIDNIKESLPQDLQDAKWVLDQREKKINDAKLVAQRILDNAQEEAAYMVQESEISKRANEYAKKLVEDAEKRKEQIKNETYEYADSIIFEMQNKLRNIKIKYMGPMYEDIESVFQGVEDNLEENRRVLSNLGSNFDEGDD